MENRAKKELERKRLIIHSVLCALLPPAGMLLVWRSRYRSSLKLIMTLGATLALTVIFSIGFSLQKPEEIVPPTRAAGAQQPAVEQSAGQIPSLWPENNAAPAPTPAPGDDYILSDPLWTEDESFVAPANPNG